MVNRAHFEELFGGLEAIAVIGPLRELITKTPGAAGAGAGEELPFLLARQAQRSWEGLEEEEGIKETQIANRLEQRARRAEARELLARSFTERFFIALQERLSGVGWTGEGLAKALQEVRDCRIRGGELPEKFSQRHSQRFFEWKNRRPGAPGHRGLGR